MVSTDITNIEKEHKMLKSIKKFLQRNFKQTSDFETYIASKNPQSAAEVDHWSRVYSHSKGGRYGI
jgi:hypothetical protein